MTKKKPEIKQDVFYVGIQDPIEIRRTLLEGSKEMLQLLQRYERFREVKREKHDNIIKLRETIREILKAVQKLKLELPTTHLRVILHEEKAKFDAAQAKKVKKESKTKVVEQKAVKKEEERVVKQEGMTQREVSELDKLESELSAIENKLSELA